MISAMVDKTDWESINRAAAMEDRSLSGYLRRLVREDLRNKSLPLGEDDEAPAEAASGSS